MCFRSVRDNTHPGGRVGYGRASGYTPVVSDGRRLYLVGYYVVGLEPTGR